jgi:hypothetical protein
LFIFLNIQPYIRAVELLANQALNYSLIQFVMSLPVIGWLLGTIASIATTLDRRGTVGHLPILRAAALDSDPRC